jgi:putative membrane protein
LASAKSLDYSIERIIKHYSQMFVLPSYRRIVLFTLLSCVIGGFLTIFLVARVPMVLALQFSLLLFILSATSDLIIRQGFMKSDIVYNMRRCAALSMFSTQLWFGFLIVGSLLTLFFDSWSFWVNLLSIGFAAVCILRLIVFSSTSFACQFRVVGSSLMQPIVCLLPMYYVAHFVDYPFGTISAVYLLVSIPISILTALLFISSVNKIGVKTIQVPTTSVLKAFLANWIENLKPPLESLFENSGGEKTIDFSLLAFEAENRVKSVTVVSSFHPGPFRNVGSSSLPFLIQEALEKKLDAVAAVPHGLFGHEFDLASQRQNQKVLRGILDVADFTDFGSKATRFVKTQKGVAGASCQIFKDCAVVTLTLAPETTEDFPRELGDFILEEALKVGLAHVIVINAHNSINGLFDVNRVMEPLKEAALDVLKKASKLESSVFEVGAAKVVPEEFSFEDGMGLGGICALVIRAGDQTCAYITIDGNNMVSGLREKILNSLKELGVDIGEVLTTDTHVVNAIIMTARGYHPLGEAISHEKLINYVKYVVREALNNLKPASTAWSVGKVSNVRVIGENQIKEMSLLADKALQRAKRTAVPLFAAAGLLLIMLAVIL